MDDQTDDETTAGEDNVNIFKLLFREALRDHQATCKTELCPNCSIDESETHSWASKHRFGALAKKFDGKTLKEHLKEKNWLSNPWPTTVATPIDAPNYKPRSTVASGLTKVKELIEKEKRLRQQQNCSNHESDVVSLIDNSPS